MGNKTESVEKTNAPLPDAGCRMPAGRQTWAEIDLDALKENYFKLRALLPASSCAAGSPTRFPRIIPVIKADAYGHGAFHAARALTAAGAEIFAVGIVEEGVALRRAGISQDILILGTTWKGQENLALEHRLILAVDSAGGVESLDAATRQSALPASVHIKVDTGMGRLGARWDSMPPLVKALARSERISLIGVFSHLSSADERDPAYTAGQMRRFEHVLSEIRKAGFDPGEIHCANSAGILYHESLRKWSARTGIAIYGYHPDSGRLILPLQPVLSLKTKVGPVRQVLPGESIGYGRRFTASRATRYATLPVGYADGLPRRLSGNCRVIIRDGWAEVVGTISMDMIAVDLTDRPDVHEGDEVILLGSSSHCSITADSWAEELGTIPYEILCAIAARVPRIIVNSNPVQQ